MDLDKRSSPGVIPKEQRRDLDTQYIKYKILSRHRITSIGKKIETHDTKNSQTRNGPDMNSFQIDDGRSSGKVLMIC